MSFIAVGIGAGVGALSAGAIGMTVGAAALAGGALAYGAKSMTDSAGNPIDVPQADPNQIGTDSLATQLALAPQVYDANALYGPKYAKLNQNILATSILGDPQLDTAAYLAQRPDLQNNWSNDPALKEAYGTLENYALADYQAWGSKTDPAGELMGNDGGLLDLYGKISPELGRQTAAANTQQRTADIADVAALGPEARAAYLAANPDLARTMATLDQSVTAAGQAAPATLTGTYGGKTALQQQLEQQAAAQLALNGQLSPEDLRMAQQAARGGAQARGLYDSNSAISAEVLNTAAMQRQRRAEAQSLAAGVDAQGQQQMQYGAGLEAQRQLNQTQLDRAGTNDQIGREMQLASMYQAQGTDPFQMVLGRSAVPSQTMGAVSQGGSTTQGPTLFNPFDPNITSIYAGNQANQTAAQIAAANNKSAMTGSLISAGSQLGAAYLMCWVARAAFGAENPRWLAVRRYMLCTAPAALRALYRARGPILSAQLITPTRRAQLRGIFERLLAGDRRAVAELTSELQTA